MKKNITTFQFIQHKYLCILILICYTKILYAQQNLLSNERANKWSDSILNTMTIDEKIGQLLMIRGGNGSKPYSLTKLSNIINEYKIGCICFFKGGPVNQAIITNEIQHISRIPLLISIDGEWGLGMRLDSTHSFPRQIVMGAIDDNDLVYQTGTEIARQCKCMGIHLNFAPDIDVNSNPKNPVIGSRSFGEDKYNVTQKGLALMKGMQDNHIIACAKHFPGHGDTENDSHLTLPFVNLSNEQIDSIHLFPFRQLIHNGVMSVMIGHLFIPVMDTMLNQATSISYPVVTGLLKEKMNYDGLIITDAMEMKGVSNYYLPGDLEVKAFEAGNDIILLPSDVICAFELIRQAVDSGRISINELNKRCRKILQAKYFAGLSAYKPIDIAHLQECLSSKSAMRLNKKIYKDAITLVKNNNQLLPLSNTDTLRIATLSVGYDSITFFQTELSKFIHADHYFINKLINKSSELMIDSLFKNLSRYNLLVVSIENTSDFYKKDFGIKKNITFLLDSLQLKIKIILNVFASPYSLNFINTDHIESVLISYVEDPLTAVASSKIIFGEWASRGHLPVSVNHKYPLHTGIQTIVSSPLTFFKKTISDLDSIKFRLIDSIAMKGIKDQAYPGCVIYAAKDGKIIYHKAFGTQTYEDSIYVKETDLYDLASLTKILATTLAVMKLVDEDKICLDSSLGTYLPHLNQYDKRKLIIRDVMTHQARLTSWIPFYKKSLIIKKLFNTQKSDKYSIRVAENMYMKNSYVHTIKQEVYQSKLSDKKKYVYSDLGFYLLKELVEKVTGQALDDYVSTNFYKPMELNSIGFCPRNNFNLNRIIPTENDTLFRKQLIQGDVHDPFAAMLGGVSGHAGLFSNAYDVAAIMQMVMNGGQYNGKIYFKNATVREFTKYQFSQNANRRALGFDKPALNGFENTAKFASPDSFGHSGFTGTFTWADPDNDLVFVFLSNRIYPSANNNKLVKNNFRTDILQLFYEAIK